MINIQRQAPASPNNARLQQLESTMQRADWETLRDHRDEVMEFVRLGRKWGFFSIAEQTSAKAGRDVLANAYMPESNLAALMADRNPASMEVLERTIDDGLANDPKYLARFLVSRIDALYAKESKEHGTVALTAGDAPTMLEQESQPEQFLRWVNRPAPVHAVSDWFTVIKKNGLSPADVDAVYAYLDAQSANRAASDIRELSNDERAALRKTNIVL